MGPFLVFGDRLGFEPREGNFVFSRGATYASIAIL
jgi:hypothetical protein